jgi:hypothetical protein
MPRPYQQAGLVLAQGAPVDPVLVRALQTDLRSLGYLQWGIDGDFGNGTAGAVRSLSYDLLNNIGASSQSDGRAPVRLVDYNRGRVTAKTALVDQNVAACISDLMDDTAVPKLPSSPNPLADNQSALAAILANVNRTAPSPFIGAMVIQESSGLHFKIPSSVNADSYITVGLDRNDPVDRDHITSRGYGLAQATLFHHPPRPEEVQELMVDPVGNVQHAYGELRGKFDSFVVGPTDNADDRTAEHPSLPLRLCKYSVSDQRYMRDCQRCSAATSRVTIARGTPCYPGASFGYQPDQYYPSATYVDVPNRADFLCDWPYAARRYNGSGNDSFHYQTHVLLNLVRQSPVARS